MKLPNWYKIKGYYHISPQNGGNWKEFKRIESKISSKSFVSNYAFYPLLHTVIKERKYKKNPYDKNKRCHSYIDLAGISTKNTKKRPLHYANHFDALIFSFYAEKLQQLYESKLKTSNELDNCITAYRKIPIEVGSSKNKGNIHFAKDVFEEIKKRTIESKEIIVLTFDIKSFFSTLNHNFLKDKWTELLGGNSLPLDHLNVFNAATKFSFIYKNDLKRLGLGNGKKFDEKRLAKIRNEKGFKAFFESPKDFRNHVKDGTIHIYQNEFKNEKGEKVGIPQGLPISAVLANLYLIDFDKTIISELVIKLNCFYRRYSDDIIIICMPNQLKFVNDFVIYEMKKQEVIISEEKTEVYKFQHQDDIISIFKKEDEKWQKNKPLNYLGFEFYGNKTLIKSANLSKFYRRMIYAVKSKSNLALKVAEKNKVKPVIFKRPLFRIYSNVNLDNFSSKKNQLFFKKLETGLFRLKSIKFRDKTTGNYFSYAKRSSEIMNDPSIYNQIRNEKKIFNQALDKHFHSKKKNKSNY